MPATPMERSAHRRRRRSKSAWTEIAGAAGTVLAPSGLAAITLALMTPTSAGDHILVSDSVYRPTRHFCDTILKRMGVTTTYYDPLIGSGIEALVTPKTRLIFLETPGSQSFEVQDVPAIVAVAKAKGLAPFSTILGRRPCFCRRMNSASIWRSKPGRNISPAIPTFSSASSPRTRPGIRACAQPMTPSPCAPGRKMCFWRCAACGAWSCGSRRRSGKACSSPNGSRSRKEVAQVLHPALPSCPGHAIWKRDFAGASGLFSVILAPCSQAALAAFLDGLTLFGMGYSWGGYESLVIPFDCRSYRTATHWAPPGPALRFSIGLEDADDLKADLEAGFARLSAVG